MAKRIFNNFMHKIVALIIALALWFICINLTDPISQITLSVSVSLQNTGLMSATNKYVEVANNSDKIRVTIKDARSIISNISAENITATADLSRLTDDGRVPIDIQANTRMGERIENITSDKDYITVNIEDVISKQLPVDIRVVGKPASDHILGETSTAQNVIIVSGPASVMENVETAEVEIDVTDATSDINTSLPITLLNSEGDVIRSDKLTFNKNEVSTTALVLTTKAVNIGYTTIGDVAEGYKLSPEAVIEPAQVIIAGRESQISAIQRIVLEDAIDVSGLSGAIQVQANIKSSLPSGVRLVNPSHGEVIINLTVEEEIIEEEQEKTENTDIE